MTSSKKKLHITNVARIDYPELRDRQEVSPLGLLIYFTNTQVILRINIGNTGQNIDFSFQSQKELPLFFSKYYGVLITDSESTDGFSNLRDQFIMSMCIGYYPGGKARVQGSNFEMLNGEIVAIQLFLSDANTFTFYNSGDEGHYSFAIPYRMPKLPFGGVFWRELCISPSM